MSDNFFEPFAFDGEDTDLTLGQWAAAEFEAIDTSHLLKKGLSSETISAIAIDLRLAATIVAKTKAEMLVSALKSRNENSDVLHKLLDSFDDTLNRLEGYKEVVEAAQTRMLVVMAAATIEGAA